MPAFKTLEISNPNFENNNLRFITVKTPHLKGRGDICVYVPPGTSAGDTLPIVILLHGMYGSAWSWAYSAGIHLRVNEMIQNGELPPMIIAMPSDGLWGDGSAFLPLNGFNFEKWIAEDVPEALRECINGAKKSSPLFISGLSMGGFGALRIGAKYGSQFRAISGHSSITSLPQIKFFAEEPLKGYAQDDIINEDVFETFLHYRKQLPPLRFDCGTDDLLINYNRILHKKMVKEGIPHHFEEHTGSHEWAYWSKHIISSLKFFAAYM
ncbi:alpha/beta hydrolase-fold protein [uncultured Mucilaginibacter sp.]|uniref:alpha/beta hydrolase n=1 Tax=uncultured Mucilaginibacter sp. TaxID=797541 RepID=UPI0025E78795|nr:alpha/beta hydrolase-fold protein [uncultured Mucilaginibacter sp.]